MSAQRTTPRIVVAGTNSGVGKTTVVVSLVRAFAAEGLRVAVFKCGPDYLDPTYHARAAGRPCHNLDGWMMGREAVLATFRRASEGADIAIIEGVMGLFDGASPTGEEGSTAEIAKWLGAPVILVVDAGGMARSVAAIGQGFAKFDPDLDVAGLICNRVGSPSHLDILRRACTAPPVLGGFKVEKALSFPERHLGLFSANDRVLPEATLDAWGKTAGEWLGTSAILRLAREAREPEDGNDATTPSPSTPSSLVAQSLPNATISGPLESAGRASFPSAPSTISAGSAVHPPSTGEPSVKRAPRCRIGLAWDAAFHFYYDDNLARLESLGAELVRFSPITGARLPDVDGLYLGGGYPEVHAAELSKNTSMRASIVDFARSGGPIYAECGGLIYLSRSIETRDGVTHPMVGLLSAPVVMKEKLAALGYVEVETQEPTILGPAGLRFRGHQFRYSELGAWDAPPHHVYSVRKRRGGETGLEGYATGSVVASYVHAHFASNPKVAQGFVNSCARRRTS